MNRAKHLVFIIILLAICLPRNVFAQKDLVISGGNSVSSLVCSNNKVFTWGNNEGTAGGNTVRGMLGTGNTTDAFITVPTEVVGFPPNLLIDQVNSGSGTHFVAVDCNSDVWAWGSNAHGQVGNGTSGNIVTAPTRVSAGVLQGDPDYDNGDGYLTGVDIVFAGNVNTFAILNDGRLVSWGGNDGATNPNASGQLGDGTTVSKTEPVFVTSGDSRFGQTQNQPLQGVTQIYAGDQTALALVDLDGDGVGMVYSFGTGGTGNNLGRNADGTANPNDGTSITSARAYPVIGQDGEPLSNITQITAGDVSSFALDTDGYVWGWGNDWNGSDGDGIQGNGGGPGNGSDWGGSMPRRVAAGEATGAGSDGTYLLARQIGAGQANGMAVTMDNKPVAWGGGGCTACLGNETTNTSDAPVYIVNGATGQVDDNVILINKGDKWGFYATDDNEYFAWGENDLGQLGIDNTTNQTSAASLVIPSGCDFRDPPPAVNLYPRDTLICENSFTSAMLRSSFRVSSDLDDAYEVRWYKDGNLLETGTPSSHGSFEITDVGLYRVEIEYVGANGSCNGYPVAFGETTVEWSEPHFEDPGTSTYCGNTIEEAAVEGTGTFRWFANVEGGDPLATSIDDGNIDTPIDISDAGLDSPEADVYRLWVEDVGSFFATLATDEDMTASNRDPNTVSDAGTRLDFTVFQELQLRSVNVTFRSYDERGRGIIEIYSADDQLVATARSDAFGTTGFVVMNMEFDVDLDAGDYYIIAEEGQLAFYTNVGNALQEYTHNGFDVIGFTGTGEAGKLPIYQDWNVKVGTPFLCGRIPVDITEDCPPCQNPYALTVSYDGNAVADGGVVRSCEDLSLPLEISSSWTAFSSDAVDKTVELYIIDPDNNETVIATETDGENNTTLEEVFTFDASDVVPALNGTYIIGVRNTEQCSLEQTIELQVDPTPEATLSGDASICETDSAPLEISLTEGTAPFTVDVFRNGTLHESVTATASPFELTVSDSGTYSLQNLIDDNGCSGAVSGTATVSFYEEAEATVTTECSDDGHAIADDEFVIVVSITQGELSNATITETSNVGVTFTETSPGSGVYVSNAIDETNAVDITVADDNGCNTLPYTGLQTQCSCPVTASAQLDDESICAEDSTDIIITLSTTGSSTTYDIVATHTASSTVYSLTGQAGPTGRISVSEEGTYNVEVTGVEDGCTVNGGAVTLDYFDVPEATLAGSETICNDGTTFTPLTFNFPAGQSPFDVDVLHEGNAFRQLIGIEDGDTIMVQGAGDYTLNNLIDANGCTNTISETATITHVDTVTADIIGESGASIVDQVIQTANTIYDLQATYSPSGYTPVWDLTSGQGTLPASGDNVTLSDMNDDGQRSVELTLSDDENVCPDKTLSTIIEKVSRTPSIAGEDSTVCVSTLSAQAFSREGNPAIPGIEQVWWRQLSPAGNVIADGDTSELVLQTGIAPGEYEFEYLIYNNVEEDTSKSSFKLTVNAEPSNITPDSTNFATCAESLQLPGQTPLPATATGVWTVTQFPSGTTQPTIADSTDAQTMVSGLDENGTDGTTVFSWTVTNGACTAAPETVTIDKVGTLSTPLITMDGGRFNNADVTGTTVAICDTVQTYSLTGSMPEANEAGRWIVESGTSVEIGANENDRVQSLNIQSAGTTVLTWEISSTATSQCDPVTNSVTLEVFENPVAEIISTHADICEGEDVTAEASPINSTDTGVWTTTSGTVAPNVNNELITISGLPVGPATLVWTVSNPGCPEKEAIETFTVVGEKTPTMTLSAAGLSTNDPVCIGNTIDYSVTTSNIDINTLRWTVSGDASDYAGETSVNLSPSVTGSYQVSVTGDVPTEVPSCFTANERTDALTLQVLEGPSPQLVHSEDTVQCEDEPAFEITEGVSDTQNTWQWYVNNEHYSEADNDETFSIREPGLYQVTIREDNGVCPPVSSESVTVQIDRMPMVDVLSERYIGFINEDLPLQAVASPYDSIYWEQPAAFNVLNRTDSLTTLVNSPEGFVDRRFTLYVYNGVCVDTVGTDVTIRTPVKVYNSFTPNGDGINDTWTIEGIETYTSSTIRVFNRWGNVVFEEFGGYDKPWDGTRNSNELPVGTYYYVIDLGDTSTPIRGDVTIVR